MLLFVLTPIVMAYNLSLVVGQTAPELVFHFELFDLSVCALLSFLHSALVSGLAGFSSVFTGVEEIAVRGVVVSFA